MYSKTSFTVFFFCVFPFFVQANTEEKRFRNQDRLLELELSSEMDPITGFENAYAGYGIDNKLHKRSLWPNGIIPYFIESHIREYYPKLASRIREGMRVWNQKTGGTIRFVEYTNQKAFRENRRADDFNVGCHIELSDGNSAYVGVRTPFQECMFLTTRASLATVLHELGHSIGLYHEQCRDDRNNYLRVNWDNIVDAKNSRSGNAFGRGRAGAKKYGPFDWNSIMIYHSTSYSRNGKATLEKLDGSTVKNTTSLSRGDIETVRLMYGWPKQVPTKQKPRPTPRKKPKKVVPKKHNPDPDNLKPLTDYWKSQRRQESKRPNRKSDPDNLRPLIDKWNARLKSG